METSKKKKKKSKCLSTLPSWTNVHLKWIHIMRMDVQTLEQHNSKQRPRLPIIIHLQLMAHGALSSSSSSSSRPAGLKPRHVHMATTTLSSDCSITAGGSTSGLLTERTRGDTGESSPSSPTPHFHSLSRTRSSYLAPRAHAQHTCTWLDATRCTGVSVLNRVASSRGLSPKLNHFSSPL